MFAWNFVPVMLVSLGGCFVGVLLFVCWFVCLFVGLLVLYLAGRVTVAASLQTCAMLRLGQQLDWANNGGNAFVKGSH